MSRSSHHLFWLAVVLALFSPKVFAGNIFEERAASARKCTGDDGTVGKCSTCCGCCGDPGCAEICWNCGKPTRPSQATCEATRPKPSSKCKCLPHGRNGGKVDPCYTCGKKNCDKYLCNIMEGCTSPTSGSGVPRQCPDRNSLGCSWDYDKAWIGSKYFIKNVTITYTVGSTNAAHPDCCGLCNVSQGCAKINESVAGLNSADDGKKVTKVCSLYKLGAQKMNMKGNVATHVY